MVYVITALRKASTQETCLCEFSGIIGASFWHDTMQFTSKGNSANESWQHGTLDDSQGPFRVMFYLPFENIFIGIAGMFLVLWS